MSVNSWWACFFLLFGLLLFCFGGCLGLVMCMVVGRRRGEGRRRRQTKKKKTQQKQRWWLLLWLWCKAQGGNINCGGGCVKKNTLPPLPEKKKKPVTRSTQIQVGKIWTCIAFEPIASNGHHRTTVALHPRMPLVKKKKQKTKPTNFYKSNQVKNRKRKSYHTLAASTTTTTTTHTTNKETAIKTPQQPTL